MNTLVSKIEGVETEYGLAEMVFSTYDEPLSNNMAWHVHIEIEPFTLSPRQRAEGRLYLNTDIGGRNGDTLKFSSGFIRIGTRDLTEQKMRELTPTLSPIVEGLIASGMPYTIEARALFLMEKYKSSINYAEYRERDAERALEQATESREKAANILVEIDKLEVIV